jgi:adenylate cyclase
MRDAPGSGRLEEPREAPSLLRFAGLSLDLDASTLVRETGEAVALTRGEFALLRVFVTRPGRVLSRDALLDALANRRFEPFDRSIDVMVGKLRRKIEPDSKQPRLIITVPGEGYRFDGLAKSPLSGQGLTMAVPVVSSGNDEALREDALSDAPPELYAEQDSLEAEAKQASQAAIDQTKSSASKPGGLVLLGPAIAAVLFLAAAGGWFVLAGKGGKTTEPARLSIVVMPFANLSGDPGQDYLVDALTDELTTSLARMRDSFVIARNTAMTFKGKPIDAKAVGKDLGVRYLLEGSVQPSGDRMRVNAQLIDAGSGAHLWAEQFDTPRADLLQTQDAIVAHLANTLDLQLQQAYVASVKRTPNRDAEDLALQCSEGQWKAGFIGKGADAAYALCEQALAIDPDNVRALMALGVKFWISAILGVSGDPKGDLGRADELESKALALDPDWTWPHDVKGGILREQGRAEEAVAEHERALALDPSNVDAAAQLGIDYRNLGRFDESLEYLDRAILGSPSDPALVWWYENKAWANFGLKRFDQAIEWARRSIAINPDSDPFSHLVLVASLALADHDAQAREALQRYLTLPSTGPLKTIAAWKAYYSGERGDARFVEMNERINDGLRKAGMPEGEAKTH